MRRGNLRLLIGLGIVLLLTAVWLVNLVWLRPFSINLFLERAYIEFLWNDPEALTQTGVLKPFGLSGYESELSDHSPSRTKELADIGRRNLKILETYDRDGLSEENRISYEVMHWFLTTGVQGEPFLFHDYPVTHISGPQIDYLRFMRSLPLNSKDDIENYLSRLERTDEKFGSLIDGLEERRKLGVVAPTFILSEAIKFCESIANTNSKENLLYTHFEKYVNEISLLNPRSKEEYLALCLESVDKTVRPEYKRLANYLLQLERNSLAIAGVWQLPDGDKYYRFCLLQNTGTTADPENLYETGKSEMERTQSEMIRLLESMGIHRKGKTLSETLEELALNRKMTFDTTAEGREECLGFFETSSSDIRLKLPDYFNLIPSTEMQVLEVARNRAEKSPLAFYVPPLGDPLEAGKLYINTWRAQSLNRYLAEAYAHHEGIPGHHLQKAIQAELTGIPTFRRFVPFEAYTEGWAMYAEQLALEMSESDDEWKQLAVLQSDLFRTTRMLTDIGIHHKKWLRDQAISFMMENAGLMRSEAEAEVDRYIVWPGQGCSYKVGQLKFLELRELAKQELGDSFNIKEFHDVLLGNGAMPISVLDDCVRAYIKARKAQD